MSFDGWYLNEELSQQVTADYMFYENTILYAKWSPKDEGYYVYFMDFEREGQVPLVLVTYSVTEGQTVSPYVPGNAPAGTEWNGKWYLESDCENPFNFLTPVSDMTDYLTGANGRDLYLYPGTQAVCRAIFVTYGTKVDPVTVPVGGTIDLDQYRPERTGFVFAGYVNGIGDAVITGGRYDKLTLTQELTVETATSDEPAVRKSQFRSDGTVDQLYLSLRLAVAEALTPDAPLVLDDALVRFDDTRLATAMEILKEEAQQKQVILFTCQSREQNMV